MAATGRSVASVAVALGLSSFAADRLRAQADCFPSKGSNEAQVFGIFSVPLAFSPGGAPAGGPGRIQVGLEVSYLPSVDTVLARPTVCRPGKEAENTDLLTVAPRPRLTIDLGRGFLLEGSWTPPIRVNQVRANLFGLALGYRIPLGSAGTGLTLRAHGAFGKVNAPITCPDEALANPLSECYQGTRSDDSYRPNILGVEGIAHWSLGGGAVRPYAGAGYNRLMPRFQVNFRNAQNQLDNRRVEVDLDRLAVFGGLSWAAASRWIVSAELYTVPADAVTGRVALRVGL